MSKATTAAPALASFSTSWAMIVRGHGHCPIAARLLSSISTIATGEFVGARGAIR
jgi:hypothetical protein